MAEDYMPTTSDVRADYVLTQTRGFDGYLAGTRLADELSRHGEAFDRWLADHDRKLRNEALEVAAQVAYTTAGYEPIKSPSAHYWMAWGTGRKIGHLIRAMKATTPTEPHVSGSER